MAVLVKDRFHAGGHGQYFEPEFVEKYWEPFIRRGEYKETEFEKRMPPTPWWISVLGTLRVNWIIHGSNWDHHSSILCHYRIGHVSHPLQTHP